MATIEPFATVGDYEKRYGVATGRVGALLEDASALLRSEFYAYHGKSYKPGINQCFDDNVCAVACSIVSRSINVPAGLEGTSQFTQTAGSYTQSLTYANPTGDLYISRSERIRLGISGSSIYSILPTAYIGGGSDA